MQEQRENVVLVDEADREVGVAPKLDAHRAGQLHRAVSVFVFDTAGRLLLQRRATGKYHSAGKWANTCCSHPRPGEAVADAARRRLREEMGIEGPLEERCTFTYRAAVGGGLIEHEVDHVFVGRFEGRPSPDLDEVQGWRWARAEELERELVERPDDFAAWFQPAFAALRASAAAPAHS